MEICGKGFCAGVVLGLAVLFFAGCSGSNGSGVGSDSNDVPSTVSESESLSEENSVQEVVLEKSEAPGSAVTEDTPEEAGASEVLQDRGEVPDAIDKSDYIDLSYVDGASGLSIPESRVGEEAVFAGYLYDDIAMEVIAVSDSDGELHLSLNTCQVCSGSPYAFFIQYGEYFVCQNCGNYFPASYLGAKRGGCNPVPIDGVIMDGGSITIPEEVLAEYSVYFRNWKGLNA